MRIAVIGFCGAGKSTLSAALSALYGCPLLHLDRVQFSTGWTERDTDAKRADVRAFLDRHADWVIDGNYSLLYREERFDLADQIIFLDYPRFRCLFRVIRRYFRYRGTTRADVADGCPERIDAAFVRWILWEGRTKEKLDGYRRAEAAHPAKFVRLSCDRTVRNYIKKQEDAIHGTAGV